MPLLIVGIGAALFFSGRGIKDIGEGVDELANASIKLAVVGGAGFLILKKLEVI